MITTRHIRDTDGLFVSQWWCCPRLFYSLHVSVTCIIWKPLFLKPTSQCYQSFCITGCDFLPILPWVWAMKSSIRHLCVWMSLHSPVAAQGFHSHLNHPSSILPRLLYSSPCLALPSASWAEAQWSAVQRYITSRGGGGERRGPGSAGMQIWNTMLTTKNGGWEEGEKGLKRSWRCNSFFLFFPHCSGGKICDCYDSKQSAGTTPFFKIAPAFVSVLCSVCSSW